MKDNLDGYLNFYSVSGDGRVTNWTIVKTALWNTDVLSITFTKQLENFTKEETFRIFYHDARDLQKYVRTKVDMAN